MSAQTALSLKQPWATLLVHGLKTIEVRTWPVRQLRTLLIHAANDLDTRPEAWQHVPPNLEKEARKNRGGIVGMGDLIACHAYHSEEAFNKDQQSHLNEPSWFQPPVLYGLQFSNLRPLPFHPCPGQTRFFRVEMQPTTSMGLLVSVRSAVEAQAALVGGAKIVDIKEPHNGSLGRAEDSTIVEIARVINRPCWLSAALGEQSQAAAADLPAGLAHLDYVKWGLAGCNENETDWRNEWRRLAARVREANPACQPVVVAYADWQRAGAPCYVEVSLFALEREGGVLLLDTWHKDGSPLFEHISVGDIENMIRLCRLRRVQVALAGSLGLEHLDLVRQLRPSWLAVRGAACSAGRMGTVEAGKVRSLVEGLAAPVSVPARRRGRRSRRGS